MKNETFKISSLIKQLEGIRETEGDLEIFMANEAESCFDGVGTLAIFKSATNGDTVVGLVRNEQSLKLG